MILNTPSIGGYKAIEINVIILTRVECECLEKP